jgi:hypothetical protein
MVILSALKPKMRDGALHGSTVETDFKPSMMGGTLFGGQ